MRLLLGVLIGALSLSAQITQKAYTDAAPVGASTTVATTSTLNIATGDTIIACVGRGEGGSSITGISDGGSNTFTKVGSTATSTDNTVGAVDMWVKTNAVANAAATLTATISISSDFRLIMAGLYSGLATSSVVDQTSCHGSPCTTAVTSTNVTATNVTTTQANELLLYCGYNNNSTNWTAAGSWNLRTGTIGKDHQLADLIVSSTGSYPGGNVATVNTSVGQVGVFGTFKQAGGGGGGSTPGRRRPVIQ